MDVDGPGRGLRRACAVVLPLFVLAEINYPSLSPQSELAIFAGLGLAIRFLIAGRQGEAVPPWWAGLGPALLTLAIGAYLVVQTEPASSAVWSGGASLGDRAGGETRLDLVVGAVGLALVLWATWRAIGWALPVLAGVFLAYAHWGSVLPDWLLPIRGYGWERIVSQGFLHSQGVYGVALRVMFSYVFLFVLFGVVLEATGATRFVLDASRRLFRGGAGSSAKVAVLSSGLMGSLSGSAVANTATTGTFTIPMMRAAGFRAHVAAGLEAAASSGGALVPPVMGAGAYMMLEIVEPPVTYVEIVRAALLPAILYYVSLFTIVHLEARKLGGAVEPVEPSGQGPAAPWAGAVFGGGLASLVGLLLAGFSVFRSVSLALAAVLALAWLRPETRPSWRALPRLLERASYGSVTLIAAAACVGIVIGVVTLTGIGSRLPALLLPLAESNLPAALALLMVSSIVLGMGLPSAVCYLLLATLVGPVLGELGVVPLGAHLFIFYFGLMSMVTPPVALAAYAASSIARSEFWRTSLAAFRFALVGFTLPFMFVFRPELLMLTPLGEAAPLAAVAEGVVFALLGLLPLAAAIAGHLRRPVTPPWRLALVVASFCFLLPGHPLSLPNLSGAAILVAVGWSQRRPTPPG